MPRLALLLLLFALSAQAHAQDCSKKIPITIFDQNTGWSIKAVGPTALEAKAHNTTLVISGLDYVPTGRLFILIDESGSMSEAPEYPFSYQGQSLRTIKQTLREFTMKLPHGLSIQYGFFNDKWVFSESFSSDPRKLREGIDNLTAQFGQRGHGHTALFDALHEALSRFGEPQPGDSILLITDGRDNSSKLSFGKLEQEFHAANVRLLAMVKQPSRLEEADDRIRQLAEGSGGFFLGIDSASSSWEDKKGTAENVSVLRNFWIDKVLAGYVVTIQMPATLKADTKWRLAVQRKADVRLKHAALFYPSRLSACPVTTAKVP